MRKTEIYHTLEELTSSGIEPYLSHVRQYLAGQRTVPVSKANTLGKNMPAITFTFSNDLLRQFISDLDSLKKPYETAMKYGFRGYSRGGKNGIFYQRECDGGLLADTDKLLINCHKEAALDLEHTFEQPQRLEKVKIVWHNPCGDRVVGVYNPNLQRILFLGFANYSSMQLSRD